MSFLKDNSIDAIITDHAYDLKEKPEGETGILRPMNVFNIRQEDFDEKIPGVERCFLVEFMWKKMGKIMNTSKMAKEEDLEI